MPVVGVEQCVPSSQMNVLCEVVVDDVWGHEGDTRVPMLVIVVVEEGLTESQGILVSMPA